MRYQCKHPDFPKWEEEKKYSFLEDTIYGIKLHWNKFIELLTYDR